MTERNNSYITNMRMKFTRQSIVTNIFLQMPRFLISGEFAGNKISNNARILYVLLYDRHRVSVKNGWFDESDEAYIYFKREDMEQQLGISERTVSKVMQELKGLFLVEEKKQGLNKPSKIYLLSPIVSDGENREQHIDHAFDYNPEYEYCDISENVDIGCSLEPAIFAGQEPQNLSLNHNKLNNNLSDNETSKTDTATSSETPYSQILEIYNQLCETHNLRPIHSIIGKRKTQTATNLKEYGLSGFFDLFDKVAESIFLCGGGDRGWKVDYNWLITPANMQKVLEGKYDNTPFLESALTTSYKIGGKDDPYRAVML